MITQPILDALCLTASGRERSALYLDHLNVSMSRHLINTPMRAAMFLAQVAHESGEFRYVQELASGSAYEGRKDLGNTEPGDGVRFKGRGLIQITGRANYEACGRAIGADFIADPALMEQPTWAVGSAAWFWQQHGMNELADAENFDAITRRINGGSNGQQDRLAYLMRAKKAMGI